MAEPRGDQGGLMGGSTDRTETTVPAAQLDRGTTNPGGPVSADAENGTGDLRAETVLPVIELRRMLERLYFDALAETDGKPDLSAWIDQVANALLAAGWRPPLPDGGEEIGDDVIVHFEGRPVVGRPLSVKVGWEGDQFVELPRDFAVPAGAPLPDSQTEWGRRWPSTGVVQEFGHSRQDAEDGAFPGTELVRREVGPWIEVQP